MNIIEYRHDPKLAGGLPHMQDPATQIRWDAFLKATYGLELTEAELEIFRVLSASVHARRRAPE